MNEVIRSRTRQMGGFSWEKTVFKEFSVFSGTRVIRTGQIYIVRFKKQTSF